ncbi:hypothetical protein [Leuconostoc pseudomesenteroides]|uniref:hypothetical protein n=1 Tax=Leuconostoc pseudomesenteroides TaxID=33968 RepID=UPI0039E897BF
MDDISSKYLTQMIERDKIHSIAVLALHLPYNVIDVIDEAIKLGYSVRNIKSDANKAVIVK